MINKDFNFSKIQNFVLSEPKAVYPRPYLSYDLSKQNGLKIEYPFGGGFNGKYMILEAVNDTSIRVFNYDNQVFGIIIMYCNCRQRDLL